MQVHVNARHRVLVTPATDQLANLFSDAKSFHKDNVTYAVIPHGITETLALRGLGYGVPAPIESHYDFGVYKPFDVQLKTCALLTLNKRAYVLNGLGTGKTKSALWAFDYLKRNGHANKALVCSPLSTLMDVWGKEIFQTVPHLKFAVLHGSRQKRLDRLNSDADVFIINHDGVSVLYDEIEALAQSGTLTNLILDELAVYRNPGAARAKSMAKLAQHFEWVWGMTGTPTPNAPSDVWAQCKIVTPNTMPMRFGKFRELVMYQESQFKWKPKDDGVSIAFDVMQPAVRYSLDDIIELPECVTQDLAVTLGSKQKAVYKQIVKTAQAAIDNHEITAMNAGAIFNKLLQVSMGWVYSSTGDTVQLDNDGRIQALLDIIDAADKKVIVFVPFKHALSGISKALTANKIEHAVVSGDTPLGSRTEIFRLFQSTDKYKVLAAHPKCMSHGLTLTAATVTVWFGPITSAETFEQANARPRRLGQKHKQLLVRMFSTPVEKKVYAMLEKKQNVQSQLLALFEDASI